MILTILSFIRSPVGKYLQIGLAVVLIVVSFATWQRSVQHASDMIHERKAVAAVQANLDTCHANVDGLMKSVAVQNAAIDLAKAEGDRRAKMLADGLSEARRGRAGAEARAAGLLSHPPVGVDACARSEAAREAVLRSLN